ncbi:MAG: Rpn family recombination-promoting nuclease/putative transposase [Pirellulaceae bacterium]|nr:Rpn family recombination-promoting nuclease/putative transposase [Pirellulaceae bacterium]
MASDRLIAWRIHEAWYNSQPSKPKTVYQILDSMPLGIRPTVDFAFKKMFGDPNNRLALISLLNAILELPSPIADVTIENPFNYQDYLDDKLSILDIKATDTRGSVFNIEMQLSVTTGLVKRLVFYGCELYVGQLSQGQDYTNLKPVYSICILDALLWDEAVSGHHRFRLVDTENTRILENSLEIHLLELPRYTIGESELASASPVERWVFLLRHAHEYDADQLRRLFPEIAFQQAIQSIENIALKTEDKLMYDTREKAVRDYQWLINGARNEGREEGREEGIEQGIEQGIQQGREEGMEKGALIGTIRTCQAILGLAEANIDDLRSKSPEELESMAIQLQSALRGRLA